MKSPKAAPPPDPAATAAAQGGMNRDTAISQQMINMVDQTGPEGSIKYGRAGDESYIDSTGKTITTPRFTQTTSLSDAQKGIYDTNQQTQQNIATIGRDQSARIGGILGKPVNLSNEATEARLMDLGRRRLDPQFARDEETTRTRLANMGLNQGSAAWDAEMGSMGQRKNDAINQLLLTGRGMATQEALTERNQPINEITALMSGSQVSMPHQNNTPQANVAGVDYAGMVQNQHAAQVEQQKMKNANNNALMGGLFSLAGTLGSAAMGKPSDRRLKSNIHRLFTRADGLGWYEYNIFGRRECGVMADEVKAIYPHAVSVHPAGFDTVDYARLAA